MNTPDDKELIGSWISFKESPTNNETTKLDFTDDGQLIYTILGQDRDQKIFLTYRVENDVIITDQISSPNEERTKFSITSDNQLILVYGDVITYYKRFEDSNKVQMNYPYLLVVQFDESLGLDKLIEIEDVLIDFLLTESHVDGHDIGGGQMNIFIYTDMPSILQEEIVSFLKVDSIIMSSMKIAYRDVEGEDFICLWPKDLKQFIVI